MKTNPLERKIKQHVLEATQGFLNDIAHHINRNGGLADNKTRMDLCKKHNQSYSIFFAAVRCGYITSVGRYVHRANDNRWKVTVDKFEPIHARVVLSDHYDRAEENRQNRIRAKTVTFNPTEIKPESKQTDFSKSTRKSFRQPIVPKPEHHIGEHTRVPNKKKAVSLLWGLIKINW